METTAVNVNVNVTTQSQSPLFGLLSTVVINQTLQLEEFLVNEKDGGSVTSVGFFPASSSSSPPPKISLQLETFKPDYVYQILNGRLHDRVLSQKVFDEIVVEAQRRITQGFKQPLFMEVFVKLTQKVFSVIPYNSAHSITTESETPCAICLKDMFGGSEYDYCQIPNCSHCFHEICLLEWLDQHRNSCPLCGKPIYEEQE